MEYCSGFFLKQESIYIAFLLAGLTGGFTHCITMCGSFSACNIMCPSKSCNSSVSKLSYYGQIPHHLGRATTYGALGFIAAFLSKQIAAFSFWPYISAAMLVFAGVIFIVSSLPACKHVFTIKTKRTNYISGALLGFLPCSLIYALLMVAATTANPMQAMVGMWIFVLGTIPALFIVGIGTAAIAQKWQSLVQKLGQGMMVLNGLVLLVMATKIISKV